MSVWLQGKNNSIVYIDKFSKSIHNGVKRLIFGSLVAIGKGSD